MKKLLSIVLVTGLSFTLAFGTVNTANCDGTQKKECTAKQKACKEVKSKEAKKSCDAKAKPADCKAKCAEAGKKECSADKKDKKSAKKTKKQ